MDNTRPWFETKTLFSALSIGPYKINQAVYNRVILYTQLAEDIATQNRLCLYVMHAIWRKILMACQKPMCYARHLGIIWISVLNPSILCMQSEENTWWRVKKPYVMHAVQGKSILACFAPLYLARNLIIIHFSVHAAESLTHIQKESILASIKHLST